MKSIINGFLAVSSLLLAVSCADYNETNNFKADAASGSALGKIANYAFSVYFTPKKGGSYTGEITLTDGVSTATITLSGTGRKLNQSITWNQEKTTFYIDNRIKCLKTSINQYLSLILKIRSSEDGHNHH